MTARYRAAIAAVAMFACVLTPFADEVAEVYQRLYQEADTMSGRMAAVTNIVASNDQSSAPALAFALKDLLALGSNVTDPSEWEDYERIVRLVVAYLGSWRHVEAVPLVGAALDTLRDPLARAEAVLALGALRATEYSERFALMLKNLNEGAVRGTESDEKMAYALIVALEKLRDPRGFSPVFFASVGKYPQRIRDQAARSLPGMLDDPTDPVRQIVTAENAGYKMLALALELGSKAQLERKTDIARLALERGWSENPKDKTDEAALADLRLRALRALIDLKASGGTSVPRYAESFRNGSVDEKLAALQAMAADASDVAARTLADIILVYNDKAKAGLVDEVNDRLVKAAIQYAGMTRNKLVKVALQSVQFNAKWSGSVIAAATEALKSIP